MITKQFRGRFPAKMRDRFQIYWHVMHPTIIHKDVLYRHGWTDEEWEAMFLLKDSSKHVIRSGHRCTYRTRLEHLTTPSTCTRSPPVTFDVDTPDNLPNIVMGPEDVPYELRSQLDDWIVKAFYYKDLSDTLYSAVSQLLRLDFEGKNALCNTPGTLYAVWPELLPFFPEHIRHQLRNRSMKPSIPRCLDDGWVKNFHAEEHMDEVNEALATMALLPQVTDEYYPTLG